MPIVPITIKRSQDFSKASSILEDLRARFETKAPKEKPARDAGAQQILEDLKKTYQK